MLRETNFRRRRPRLNPRAKIGLGLLVLMLFPACATKKYVRKEVAATRADLDSRLDDEAQARTEISNQLDELSSLNRSNKARIEQVNTALGNAIEEMDPKVEEARKSGTQAQSAANLALNTSKENSEIISNRNKYRSAMTQEIYFRWGSADLDDEACKLLNKVARKAASDPNLVLELKGFTDSTGDPSLNIKLSERRVESVIRYLVGSLQLDLHKIHALGLGETLPVGDNKTRDGRAKNRRVTVNVLESK